ncbi:MAG TPA: hypothetical protein VFC47_00895 [Caulobacteraceae bacterium]|nr:hypothetical protein [Caulobacteraceae bacterium]
MIRLIIHGAHWLDTWLRDHLGRAYTATLGAGLVIGIIATVHGLASSFATTTNVLKIIAVAAFQLALLINQLAQFHEYREDRLRRREERQRARSS